MLHTSNLPSPSRSIAVYLKDLDSQFDGTTEEGDSIFASITLISPNL